MILEECSKSYKKIINFIKYYNKNEELKSNNVWEGSSSIFTKLQNFEKEVDKIDLANPDYIKEIKIHKSYIANIENTIDKEISSLEVDKLEILEILQNIDDKLNKINESLFTQFKSIENFHSILYVVKHESQIEKIMEEIALLEDNSYIVACI